MIKEVGVHHHIRYSTERVADYQVWPGLVLRVDLSCEMARWEFLSTFLRLHACPFNRGIYPGSYPIVPGERCYDAAMQLASIAGLIYCEGVVVFSTPNGLFPLGHAWCCDHRGNIIDPTMPQVQNDARATYLGVPIRKEYSLAWKSHTGYFGVLDGYPDGTMSPILTDHPNMWRDNIHG